MYKICKKCDSHYHPDKGGKYFCELCQEEMSGLKMKTKLSLAGIVILVLLSVGMWFRGALIAKCWYKGSSLDKETETLLITGECKINRGTKENPDWIFIDQLRGFGDSE